MSACPNCGNVMSCGCQRRTASNGTSVCSSCLAAYEVKLQNEQQENTVNKNKQKTTPDLNTWGKDRYNNLSKFVNK
jgi:hypothetical protein